LTRSRTDRVREAARRILVVDTCVLIDTLRGFAPARAWLADMASRNDVTLSHSVITAAELFAGTKSDASVESVRSLLSMTRSIPVDESIGELAAEYLRKWRPSHGIGMPDALIAATAAEVEATLVTRDGAHFPMADFAVLVPYAG
jgi:predicted nucleic acid-binding protein